MYINALTSGKYEPELFIKQEAQLAGLHKILKEDFKIYNLFFKELQYRSLYFPLVDFDTFARAILENNNQDKIQKS